MRFPAAVRPLAVLPQGAASAVVPALVLIRAQVQPFSAVRISAYRLKRLPAVAGFALAVFVLR